MNPMINRRSFLKVTVGAAAIAALGPPGYCAAPKRNLRKAIMYSTIGVKGSVLLVPGVARNGVTYQECFDRSIVEIKKAIPVAKETGVKISIENVGNNFIVTPEQAVQYLDAINSEWVGWHFDIGNVGRIGPPAERWISVIGKRINRIHVKDFSAKPAAAGARAGARAKLLDGDTNWPAVMAALDRAGYQGWAISEQPTNQAADVETARDLAQRMDRIFAS